MNNHNNVSKNNWHSIVSKYNKPRVSRSVWQIINSVGGYLLMWVLMVYTLKISIWFTIPLMIIAAGLLVRVFIIFHDCGHGSFFKSKKWNLWVGRVCGALSFTAYDWWTYSHKIHHQTVGNLDKRGLGDVWTITVDEYLSLSKKEKRRYRMFRHPAFMILLGGPLLFIISNRLPGKRLSKKQNNDIYITNLVLLTLMVGVILLIGWQAFLIIQLPVITMASWAGLYLFYVQHQYDDVIWRRNEEWDYKDMAIYGSSFFKLPSVLQWFSGNIGYHHIHHLGPTIPNYNLEKCHRENAIFHDIKPITFFRSFHSLKLRLWDEKNQKIITFRELRGLTTA